MTFLEKKNNPVRAVSPSSNPADTEESQIQVHERMILGKCHQIHDDLQHSSLNPQIPQSLKIISA